MQENLFDLGWNFDIAHCVYGICCHDEECNRLQGLKVSTEITIAEYLEYIRKHRDVVKAIPTIDLFIIKPDMNGDPTQAKSRIVALGNL